MQESRPVVKSSKKTTSICSVIAWLTVSLLRLRRTTSKQPQQSQQSPTRTTVFLLVLLLLLFCSNSTLVQASSSSSSSSSSTTTTARHRESITNNVAGELTATGSSSSNSRIVFEDDSSAAMDASKDDSVGKDEVMLVFSDVDGTLLHYPEHEKNNDDSSSKDNNADILLRLPPSATGMVGIISLQTLHKCQDIRRLHSGRCKLILVSGMRTSTLLQRLPYLPKADAYCSEAGGRIFYPTTTSTTTTNTFIPKAYNGATANDLQPFGLVEDMEWRRRMARLEAAGPDGYGNDDDDDDAAAAAAAALPVEQRQGALWDFARLLQQQHGLVLDTRGYATCFRVNRKHNNDNDGGTNNVFDDVLMAGKIDIPKQLATSTNLGCIDFYPVESGKLNCCKYLALKFLSSTTGNGSDAPAMNADATHHHGGSNESATSTSAGNDDKRRAALLLAQHAVCLCDDDNDLEMALACQHAFIPGISSESMAETIGKNPTHFTITTTATATDTSVLRRPTVQEGTPSTTEVALSLVLERIQSSQK